MSMWIEKNNALCAELKFPDFVAAFKFMTIVAELSESHQHHPNWSNVYNRVSICLTTHDAGNTVSERDLALAKAIEENEAIKALSFKVL